jgi:hypothetical protein
LYFIFLNFFSEYNFFQLTNVSKLPEIYHVFHTLRDTSARKDFQIKVFLNSCRHYKMKMPLFVSNFCYIFSHFDVNKRMKYGWVGARSPSPTPTHLVQSAQENSTPRGGGALTARIHLPK